MTRRGLSGQSVSEKESADYNTWLRPSDWLAMPAINSGDKKFAVLVAVFDSPSNYVAFSVSGSKGYTVDWGDGSATENFSSGAVAGHDYSYSSLAGTESSRGYRQAILVVTPQSSGTLTNFTSTRHPSLSTGYSSNLWLEIVMSSPNITSFSVSSQGGSSSTNSSLLESVRVVGTNAISSLNSACMSAYSLKSFVMDYSSLLTSMTSAFYECRSLEYGPEIPDTSGVSAWGNAFCYCSSLKSIPNYSFAAATSTYSAFVGCWALKRFDSVLGSSITDISSMFNGCYRLEYVADSPNTTSLSSAAVAFSSCYSLKKAPKLNLSSCASIVNLFSYCSNLIYVPEYTLRSSGTVGASSMFSGCSSLEQAPNLINSNNISTASSMFNGCYSLKYVPDYDLSSCTNVSSMFESCYSLRKAPNFVNANSLTNTSRMFYVCPSLSYVPAYNTTSVTSMTDMFFQCFSLDKTPAFSAGAVTTSMGNFGSVSGIQEVLITGIKQTISFLSAAMNATKLNALYTSLDTVSGKTITVTNNPGTASDDPTIATAKGWTVTG